MKHLYLFILTLLFASCISQSIKNPVSETDKTYQIAEYVIATFEDSKRNLWLGTIKKGVAKYDGSKLKYLTTKNGLPSNFISSIIEDTNGNIWFGTNSGLSKYNGKTFINYTEKHGLFDNTIRNILIDSKENLWIGTSNGVCLFDGVTFIPFQVPTPKVNSQINEDTKNWITEIIEDSKGNIWFGRDGYGATKYDGKNFTYFLKKDGLLSNYVQEIEEDEQGNIWFGCRVAEKDNPNPKNRAGKGGITMYTGEEFIHFPKTKGLIDNDVYEIHKDTKDNIWTATTKSGVYKFDGLEFINYNIPISIMSITEDSKGNIWLGGAGGLYRINNKNQINNITQNGPWN